jgi:hypothetical protein
MPSFRPTRPSSAEAGSKSTFISYLPKYLGRDWRGSHILCEVHSQHQECCGENNVQKDAHGLKIHCGFIAH